MGIVRAVLGGRAASAAPGMSPGFGGGGMFGSLLGGMFGAAAGMWLYDQFSSSHGNAWGADDGNRSEGATGSLKACTPSCLESSIHTFMNHPYTDFPPEIQDA
jgi:uncharacterized membrane protein YeaQ/YmgE (transglycosylase-associated protein family)